MIVERGTYVDLHFTGRFWSGGRFEVRTKGGHLFDTVEALEPFSKWKEEAIAAWLAAESFDFSEYWNLPVSE